jgi:tetratricopeptide (TPR) repeat protein
MSLGDHHPETWIAMGYYWLKKINKPTRSVYLAQKAYALDSTKIQALLLKGLALFKLKRYTDSLVHYKEAVRLIPYCFEGYKGVVDGYLASSRLSDASKSQENLDENRMTIIDSMTFVLKTCSLPMLFEPISRRMFEHSHYADKFLLKRPCHWTRHVSI